MRGVQFWYKKKQSKTEIKGGGWWISTQTVAHFLGEGGGTPESDPEYKGEFVLCYCLITNSRNWRLDA